MEVGVNIQLRNYLVLSGLEQYFEMFSKCSRCLVKLIGQINYI